MTPKQKILVTGCAGFIGWKVAEKLIERGHTVVGVDNLNDYYDPKLKEWRLSTLDPHENFHFIKADIVDFRTMEKIFEKHAVEAVINLAARAGVRASVENPWIYYETNVTGTLNLLELCKIHNVRKFVLASTSSAYGLNEIPFRESDFTDRSLSPYAASKKAAEVLCFTYHYLYGIDVTIPRYFTVYGPGGRPDMSIFRFLTGIYQGEPIEVYGDGTQRRDFTYIDDIAEGTIQALRPCGYEIVNLGNSTTVELNYVINLIERGMEKKAVIKYLPRHPADVLATWADIQKAKKLLGWQPTVNIEEGVRRTVDWFLKYQVHGYSQILADAQA